MIKKQSACIVLFLLGLMFLSKTSSATEKTHQQEAVVIVKNAVLRWEPSKSSQLYATAARGQHFRIYDQKNGYYLTMVPDIDASRSFFKWIPDWMLRIVPLSTKGLFPVIQRVNPKSSSFSLARTPIRQTYRLAPALDYDAKINIASTQTQWYKVKECGGCVHFSNAAIINNQFSAEIAIDGVILKPTSKSIEIIFLVTIWNASGKVLARDNVPIFGVNSDGGSYALSGPQILENASSAAYCSIKYQNAWTTK